MKKVIKKNISNSNNFIYKNFLDSLFFIKKNWIYFIFPIILLFICAIIGYFNLIGILFPHLGNLINQLVLKSVEQIVDETAGLSPIQLIGFIMFNNIKTGFLGMISGIYLGIYPILVIIFNGYVVGFVAEKAVTNPLNKQGIFILWRLLPHGIFEIPAILISIGLGIKAGLFPIRVKNRAKGILSAISMILIFFFLTSIVIAILLSLTGNNVNIINGLSNDPYSNILANPIISLIFSILIFASIVFSVYIGLLILDKPDRKSVLNTIKDCLRVFVFVVIPLLVIAGIIEGLLIWIIG